jgi:hypothetical protein
VPVVENFDELASGAFAGEAEEDRFQAFTGSRGLAAQLGDGSQRADSAVLNDRDAITQ